jgi:hypothetical protein
MENLVDLDPTHCVLRITVAGFVTDELFRKLYHSIARFAAQGGPYAGIIDFTSVTDGSISSSTIRDLASAAPAIPAGKTPYNRRLPAGDICTCSSEPISSRLKC